MIYYKVATYVGSTYVKNKTNKKIIKKKQRKTITITQTPYSLKITTSSMAAGTISCLCSSLPAASIPSQDVFLTVEVELVSCVWLLLLSMMFL